MKTSLTFLSRDVRTPNHSSFRITKHPTKDRRALLEREFQAITKALGSTTTAMLDKLIKDASPLSSEIDKAVKSAGLTPYPLYG